MFSKPILIAASIASAEAALLTVPTTGADSVVTTDISDVVGCGKCLSSYSNTPTWIYGGATSLYGTVSATVANALTGTGTAAVIAGGICCLSADTEETTGTNAKTYCTGVFPTTATGNTQIKYTAATYVPATLAACPHDTTNCAAVAKDKADAALTAPADQRYIALAAADSYVELTLTVNASPGTAPSMTQKTGDVCTWLVEGTCDAPVLTVPTGGGVASTPEYKFQITEWSEEFLSSSATATEGTTWAATDQVGSGTNKWYPPLTTAVASAVTDLQLTATVQTAPNNLLGEVGFNMNPTSTNFSYAMVPGQTLVEWATWLASVYTSYDAEKVKYDADAALWKTYAEYKAPEPGLFGPTEDPDAPAGRAAPRQPTQPVDVPNKIKGLSVTATDFTATTGKYAGVPQAVYNGKAGYGYPSAMMIVPVAGKTVRPWGTLAGGGQLAATNNAETTTDLTYSVRKTTNVG